MSRIPGLYRKGSSLYLLPSIPDDAPAELKNALAIRNACAIEGKCPSCGATGELTFEQNGLGHLTFHHEPECPVLHDQEAA